MDVRRGELRYVVLEPDSTNERQTFVLLPPGAPLLEVRTQDDKLFLAADLISFVNRQVEVRGRQDGTKFYLLGVSSLTD